MNLSDNSIARLSLKDIPFEPLKYAHKKLMPTFKTDYGERLAQIEAGTARTQSGNRTKNLGNLKISKRTRKSTRTKKV